jgi:nonsense-mediated mRNA decay protein 3
MFCLRRLKGLAKVKLVDASFVWTEPHSKRIKVKLTIQKEVFTNTILQQTFIVEFVVGNMFCVDCHKQEAGGDENNWVAVAQVRQRVSHKRTFFWLEQLILHHSANTNTLSIKESPDGLDFYFNSLSHCKQFIEFMQQVVPIRYQQSKKLISHDAKSNTHSYKFSYSVEMPPICKEDLVCLPPRLSSQLGGFSPLALIYKVSNQLHILDPWTLQTREISNTTFWHSPFRSICARSHLIDFMVLDVEPLNVENGKFQLCDITVARLSDIGRNDIQFYIRSHLGRYLHPGDTVAGYDLTTANLVDDDMVAMAGQQLPEILLVKKSYPNRRKNSRGARHWRLKALAKEQELARRNAELAKEARDYEEFLQELEEDPEMRNQVSMYRVEGAAHPAPSASSMDGMEDVDGAPLANPDDDDAEADFPEVGMDELLEEMADMNLGADDAAPAHDGALHPTQLAAQQQLFLDENGE